MRLPMTLTFLALATCSSLAFAHDHGDAKEGASEPSPFVVQSGMMIYGAALPIEKSAMQVSTLLKDAGNLVDQEVLVQGRITKVCQKEGCWMMIAEGDQAVRVKFGDHAFALPKDTQGDAKVLGKVSKKEVSLEMAKHLAEDAGQDPSKVTSGSVEYQIIATSVGIAPAM